MLRDVFKGRARLRIPIKGPFSSKWLKLGVSSLITRPPPKSIKPTFRNQIEATEAACRSRRRTRGLGFLV
jgi:hypothetical protein